MKFYKTFKCFSVLLLAVLTLTLSGTANGDISFSVEVDPPVNAGENATLSFFGISTVAGGESVGGFNLPVDIGGDGFGLPSNLSIVGLANGIAALSSITDTPGQNSPFGTDLIVNIESGDGAAFTIEETATLLFDLVVGTDPSTPVGSYPVVAVESPFFFVTAADGMTDITDSSSVDPAGGGSINIVAVPEPSSLALAVLALGGLVVRRRRS